MGRCNVNKKNNGPEYLWQTYAPSSIAVNESFQTPRELSIQNIEIIKSDFCNAARRANEATFEMLEIHGAHGYLLHSFFSPLSNHRSDTYGGSLENRMLFPLEVVKAVRNV